MFKISLFTFGGGYVIVPLMEKRFSGELGWINEEEMLSIITVAQSAPGAIAVNTAILTGYRIAGFPGSMAALFGTILPPVAVMTAVFFFYVNISENFYARAVFKGMTAGVLAVILDTVYGMISVLARKKETVPLLILIAGFSAMYFFKISVILVLVVCIFLGLIKHFSSEAKQK
mgnify:CR=1 FL=1